MMVQEPNNGTIHEITHDKANTMPKLKWTDIEARLCGLTEAKEILGKEESRIRDYCRDGTLRATKIRHAWILDKDSVNELAEANRRKKEARNNTVVDPA